MRNATRKAAVAEPEFEFTGFFKVTFKRNELDTSIGHQSSTNRPQPVTTGNNHINPAKSSQIQPNPATPADRKRVVISFIEENGQAKVDDYVNIIGLSAGRIRDLLRETVSDGTIEKTGKGRFTYYVLK